MPGLFDKLNVIVRAGVHDLISNVRSDGDIHNRDIHSKDIHREVEALRGRIEEALNEEDLQQQRLDALAQDIAALDRQTDESLRRGDEGDAHFQAEQVQRKQRQVALWRAELEEHRRATSELIERVNMLDAMISSASSASSSSPSSSLSAS